ncbi:MAG: trypsin-like peptidase domain-containing protein [Chloroflexi bacterium]|nr:trypsin-like peptidase domain-containing protein [Chloroflexota bacterium]
MDDQHIDPYTRQHRDPQPDDMTDQTQRYSPGVSARPAWSSHEGSTATPERWYEPADPVAATAAIPSTSAVSASAGPVVQRRGSRGGTGTVLASGGTVIALNASGALDRPAAAAAPTAASTGRTVGSSQPVTITESSATIDVAAAVSPAVVRITTTGTVDTNQGVIPETGVGSGVIYDANGWILTNRHVVSGSQQMQVELNDGRVLKGDVYGIDTLTDLAIVKIEATGLPTAALGKSDALKVGQLVVAIGSPLGTYSNSVASGIVSAKGRTITTDGNQTLNNLIQTDAAINPGNSGGPLLDADGNVVGINTAIAANSSGIGFAIPIDIARPIMEQAVAGEKLSRPYLGIRYVTITRQLADAQKLPVKDGALVGGGGPDANGPAVEPGTPAAKAGIKDGDIIVKIDGQAIDGQHPLDATLSQSSPGDLVKVDVLRDGKTIALELTLGTRPSGL